MMTKILAKNKESLTPDALLEVLTNLPPDSKIELTKLPSGEIAVSNSTPQTKAEIIEENYAHLKGVGITISQAAEKYGVPRWAVNDWVYVTNYVHFTDKNRYPRLVDEAEVALCAHIYKERKKTNTTGLPYFDQEGRRITAVKRPAASRRQKQAA